MPGTSGYAALVEIRIIDWNPGFTKAPITSAAQIATLLSAGAITIQDTEIITDNPIVAIGPLGGPWLPQPPGTYRIPQGMVRPDYLRTELITLPTYCVDGEYETSERTCIHQIIVPDASDPDVATFIGANYAPGLLKIDQGDVQPLWFILGINPTSQLPIIRDNPTHSGRVTPISCTRR